MGIGGKEGGRDWQSTIGNWGKPAGGPAFLIPVARFSGWGLAEWGDGLGGQGFHQLADAVGVAGVEG